MVDILVVGGGPAGLSAAVNAAARGKSCLVLTNDFQRSPLYKAQQIDNYAGMRGVSGRQMLDTMRREAEQAGAEFREGRVVSILPMGNSFTAAVGTEMVEGKRLILATGVQTGASLPGEEALLGRGVSTCATCDGMLYRGKKAVVTGNAADLYEEASFLQGIGVQVTLVLTLQQRKKLGPPPADLPLVTARGLAVRGETGLEGLAFEKEPPLPEDADNGEKLEILEEMLRPEADDRFFLPCDVVFVLREVSPPDALVPGLRLDGRYVAVNRRMETNSPGLYAAGDCTGVPLQVAKAVGEGLIAAQNAARSLD